MTATCCMLCDGQMKCFEIIYSKYYSLADSKNLTYDNHLSLEFNFVQFYLDENTKSRSIIFLQLTMSFRALYKIQPDLQNTNPVPTRCTVIV